MPAACYKSLSDLKKITVILYGCALRWSPAAANTTSPQMTFSHSLLPRFLRHDQLVNSFKPSLPISIGKPVFLLDPSAHPLKCDIRNNSTCRICTAVKLYIHYIMFMYYAVLYGFVTNITRYILSYVI